jgi:DNA polymerase-3 subunit delta
VALPETNAGPRVELKPAYLIAGDDQAQIEAWRTRVRARVGREVEAAFEVLKDDALTGAAAAEAIGALTLSMGRRYVLLDGVERLKERDVAAVEEALRSLPGETIVVMLGYGKVSARLEKAVKACGGEVRSVAAPRTNAYPKWAMERAHDLGFELTRDAAQALVERVGREKDGPRKNQVRQARLMRELEKIAIFADEGQKIDLETVALLSSSAAESKAYEIADALIDGDGARALRLADELRARGEEMMHILFAVLRKLSDCERVAVLVGAGKSLRDVQSELRVPDWMAKRIVSQAKRADAERLERALELLADLDWEIRGGGKLDADSALTLTLARAVES